MNPEPEEHDVHRIKIERLWDGPKSELALETAERLMPKRPDSIRRERNLSATRPPSADWIDFESHGFPVPLVVTSEAINHFHNVVIRHRDRAKRIPKQEKTEHSSMSYVGRAEHVEAYENGEETLRNVIVCDLELHYVFICGNICGEFVGAKRRVVFDEDLQIISVSGDGEARSGVM